MAKSKKRATPVNIALDASKQKEFNRKLKEVSDKPTDEGRIPGVVYISHLPWGFEEQTLREYFKQFGKIKLLRVSRSKKTGNSKGYAYVQFAHDEVAKIVAESMNNYLMFGKLIKCKHLEKPHPSTFRNANRKFAAPVAQEHSIKKHNQAKTEGTLKKNKKKLLAKYQKKMSELAEAGIDLNLENLGIPSKTEAVQSPRKRKLSEDWTEMAGPKSLKHKDEAQGPAETPSNKSERVNKLKNKKSSKLQTPVPKTVDTPVGKRNVLVEDSSEDEITFKTPPLSIRSSKLVEAVSKMEKTAVTSKTGVRAVGKSGQKMAGKSKKQKPVAGPKKAQKTKSLKKTSTRVKKKH